MHIKQIFRTYLMRSPLPPSAKRVGTGLLGSISRWQGITGQPQYPILVNSVPKCGTNLLLNIVLAIPGTKMIYRDMSHAAEEYGEESTLRLMRDNMLTLLPGQTYTSHITYSQKAAAWLEKHSVKQIIIYRDPRAYTVSLYRFIMRGGKKRHPYYEMYASMDSDSERLMKAFCGFGDGQTQFKASAMSIPSVKISYDAYIGWLQDPNVLSVRYEDFIASDGSYTDTAADITLSIMSFLGMEADRQQAETVFTNGSDPQKSHTFRRGGDGGWREEYTEEHIEAFNQVSGDLLTRLGYTW